MKNILKFIGVFASCLIALLLLYLSQNTGVSNTDIEDNARATQSIPANWEVCTNKTDTMASMLFYDPDSEKRTFSIYTTKVHPSLGYFYRAGGSLGGTLDEIVEFRSKKSNERIFMSMNKKQISKLTVNNGNTIETIEVNSTKPFTLVLPIENTTVTIYDIHNNIQYSTVQEL